MAPVVSAQGSPVFCRTGESWTDLFGSFWRLPIRPLSKRAPVGIQAIWGLSISLHTGRGGHVCFSQNAGVDTPELSSPYAFFII